MKPLSDFVNRHEGARCFVVGNGPSLGMLDLSKLRGEIFFSVNRGYLAYARNLPKIPYLIVSDPLTYEAYGDEIEAAEVGTRFYREDVYNSPGCMGSPLRERVIPLPFHKLPEMHEGCFCTDLNQGLYSGKTVVLNAVQIAELL